MRCWAKPENRKFIDGQESKGMKSFGEEEEEQGVDNWRLACPIAQFIRFCPTTTLA